MNSQLALALIAALGGGLVASILTSIVNYRIHRSSLSSQREQWVLDKKAAEYGELLSTLAQSVECMAQTGFGKTYSGPEEAKQQLLSYNKAASEARKTIEDRIFISKGIQNACILTLWKSLAGERDFNKFWNQWDWLHSKIIEAAHQELGIKNDKKG